MSLKETSKIRSFNPDKDSLNKGRNIVAYHYTSPAGAKAMLESHGIRFTDCEFLNDKSEYVHIHKPLQQSLEGIMGNLFDKSIPEVILTSLKNDYETQRLSIKSDVNDKRKPTLHSIKQRYYVFCTRNSSK